jgi:hypothetical protein
MLVMVPEPGIEVDEERLVLPAAQKSLLPVIVAVGLALLPTLCPDDTVVQPFEFVTARV